MKQHAIGLTLILLLAACATEPRTGPFHSTTMVSPKEADAAHWLSQPAVATVQSSDFQKLWNACGETARDYLFQLDRQDYRAGVLTTRPMVSKQFFEVWRKDSGTAYDVAQNSLQTIRRTIRFEVHRADDGSYYVSPKVLIERYSQMERRITSVSEYRYVFVPTDPSGGTPDVYADRDSSVPLEYWYAIGRDLQMEKDVAGQVKDRLKD